MFIPERWLWKQNPAYASSQLVKFSSRPLCPLLERGLGGEGKTKSSATPLSHQGRKGPGD